MAQIRNIDAEIGANMIGDDAQPTLRFENTSTGPGLSVDRLVVTSSATIAGLDFGGSFTANTTTKVPVIFDRSTLAGATIGYIRFVSSTASGALINLSAQGFVSAVSIVFAASANWAGLGAIPVTRSDGTLAWIPVLPPAVVTAAVAS